MKKLIKKKINKTNKDFNITNFTKKDSFYFDVTKIYPLIKGIDNASEINVTEDEFLILKNKIKELSEKIISAGRKNQTINILTEFKNHLDNLKEVDSSQTIYAKRIKNIIEQERKNSNKAISLKKIQTIYNSKYSPKRSLTTISRIMKRHLHLHFKRITVKNPKLNKNNYKFMTYLFLKGLYRGLSLDLDMVYIDETACSLENTHLKDWLESEKEFINGAETKLKEKINIIMAINSNGILHYKLIDTTINQTIFEKFFNEVIDKMTDEQKLNSIIIFDNATIHKTKNMIKLYKNKGLKILTNIPYKSEFNAIEYCFGNFKNEYYKYCFANKNEQKYKIDELLNSQYLKNCIEGCYLQAYIKYAKYIDTNSYKVETENLYEEIIKKSEEEISKSFEE